MIPPDVASIPSLDNHRMTSELRAAYGSHTPICDVSIRRRRPRLHDNHRHRRRMYRRYHSDVRTAAESAPPLKSVEIGRQEKEEKRDDVRRWRRSQTLDIGCSTLITSRSKALTNERQEAGESQCGEVSDNMLCSAKQPERVLARVAATR